MRLQKYLAGCGAASRRKCEEFITAGRVTVNGSVVTELGTQVEEGDVVTLDGKRMTPEEKKYYIKFFSYIYSISSGNFYRCNFFIYI